MEKRRKIRTTRKEATLQVYGINTEESKFQSKDFFFRIALGLYATLDVSGTGPHSPCKNAKVKKETCRQIAERRGTPNVQYVLKVRANVKYEQILYDTCEEVAKKWGKCKDRAAARPRLITPNTDGHFSRLLSYQKLYSSIIRYNSAMTYS